LFSRVNLGFFSEKGKSVQDERNKGLDAILDIAKLIKNKAFVRVGNVELVETVH